MALPGGYIPGPMPIGGITPIYNQFSGNLAGYIDENGSPHLQSSGLENYPQTLAEATAYQGRGAAAPAAPAAAAAPAAPAAAAPAAPAPAASSYLQGAGVTTVGSGAGYNTLQNAQGQKVIQDSQGNFFSVDASGNKGAPITQAAAAGQGFTPANPETTALQQMGQIDPASEALRQQLVGSYTDPSQAAAPTAAQYQSYLDTFKQVDPEEYAQRQGLATSMDSYLKSVQDQYALGSQLDPVTAMQVEQQTRAGQAARGNVYGTPQMVEEAMATGQAGEQRLQQRQAALGAALGQQQGYLGAGLGLGDTAMQLYQQGLQNKSNAQQSALSYLGSGQTPYQTGASYMNQANANAANAAQGGPVYQPASLGAGQLGTAQQAPQYGLDVGAQSQNYFNSLNNAYGGMGGGATKNKGAAAATGAMSGAVSGAAAGAPLAGPTYGLSIPIGAVIGGALGGAGGYYS